MREKENLSRGSLMRRRMSARLPMNASVKPSRGPRSTRSFSGSSGERTAKLLVSTTTGRASPSVRMTVLPYSRDESILSGSGSSLLSLPSMIVCASVSASAVFRVLSTSGRMMLWLMARPSTMPSMKNTAQCSPAGLRVSRAMRVLSFAKSARMAARLAASERESSSAGIKNRSFGSSFPEGASAYARKWKRRKQSGGAELVSQRVAEQLHSRDGFAQRVARRADLEQHGAGG